MGLAFMEPSPQNDESLQAIVLRKILWTIMAAASLFSIGAVLLPGFARRWVLIILAVFGLCLPLLFLNRRGMTKLASIIFLGGLWAIMAVAAFTGGGISAYAAVYSLTIIFAAGLLLGPRAGVAMALLCVLTNLALVVVEITGHNPWPVIPHTPITRWIAVTALIIIVMTLQQLGARTLHDALHRTRKELDERKRAEEARILSESRYRKIVELAPEAIVVLDMASGKFVDFNSEALALFKLSAEEILKVGPVDVSPVIQPDGRTSVEAAQAFIDKVLSGGTTVFEWTHRNSLGEDIPCEIRLLQLPDELRVLIRGTITDITERKQAEEDLRRISERLQLATRAARIGIWDWDVVKDELVWDDAMYRLFGIRKEDFSGAYDAWEKSLAPEDFERATAEVQAALRGEREFAAEFRIVWPDKSIHFIQAASRTFRDEAGRPLRMLGVNYDITERKLAEEQITLLQTITMDVAAARDLPSALEVVLRRVCEKTGWALGQAWIPRQDGTGLDCCPAWFATGVSLDEFRRISREVTMMPGSGLPGRVWASRQPAWIRDVTHDLNFPRAEVARKSGLKAALGVPILSGDEVIAVLEFFLSEPREEDERLVKAISTVAAQIGLVCERKLAEEKVRWSEERLRLLLDSTAEGIFGVDLEGRCTFCNAACLRLLGYDHPAELLGKEMHALIAHSRADGTPYPMTECPVVRSLQNATSAFADDDVFWRKDGVGFPAEYWSYPIFQENKHIGAVVTFLDITERKLAEESLRLSEERFAKAFQASPEPITISRHRDGIILEVNERWTSVYGYTREEAVGHTASELNLVEPEVRERLRGRLEKQRSIRELEVDFKTRRGEIRHISLSAEQIVIDNELCNIFLHRDITERKIAEENLRREQELSETTINSMPGVFYLFNSQGRYLRWNKNHEQATGYTHEEMTERHPLDFVIEGEHQLITDRIREVLVTGEATAEATFVAKDGQATPYFFTGRRVVIDGEPCVIGMGIDITERKRAEESLRASEERFSKAFNSSPIRMGIVRLRDGAILDVNDRWLQETGYSREEIIGRQAFELTMWLGDEQQSRLRRILNEARPLRDVEYELVTKTGEQRFTLISAEVIDLDGEPCYLWASNDITERKRAEEALRESERRFSDTLTNIEMIAVMADMKGNITFCNDYLLRLTGWNREDAIGRNWYEMFLPEAEKAKVSELLNEVDPRGEVAVHMENEIKTRSGERRLVKWTNTTLRGLDGQVIGVAALGDDITERKAAEEQLKSSTAQLRALSARLQSAREEEGTRIAREIHDELGSALTGLKWDLEELDKMVSSSESDASAGAVRERISLMSGLIDATIDTVRRISSELRPGILDDLGLVAAIEWQAQQFEQRTGIVCSCAALPENLDLSHDHATAVFRVFQEILTNVLRHAQATRVDVRVSDEAGSFVLEVKDNGRGITEMDKTNTRSLGLLGMRERVQLIGGEIHIEGRAGQGTKVVVKVPIG